MPTGEEITGFGDSIVVTSADGLEARFPGIMLDARSIRQWPDGERAVQARLAEGTVRRAVFLDFGTNAGVRDEALVRRVLDSLGDRLVVVVNLYGGSHWIPEANATLARIVADYPNAVVADWHGAISAAARTCCRPTASTRASRARTCTPTSSPAAFADALRAPHRDAGRPRRPGTARTSRRRPVLGGPPADHPGRARRGRPRRCRGPAVTRQPPARDRPV